MIYTLITLNLKNKFSSMIFHAKESPII